MCERDFLSCESTTICININIFEIYIFIYININIFEIYFFIYFFILFIYLFIYLFIIIIFRYAIAYLRTGSYAPEVILSDNDSEELIEEVMN